MGLDAETAAGLRSSFRQLEEQGMPLVDEVASMPLDQPEGQIPHGQGAARRPAGRRNPFRPPPVRGHARLRAITPDWPSRVANYHAFMSREIGGFLEEPASR